ncbi:MAG TPA: TIGR02996 domain-containing protein [Kofleriaceae bacterium]|jgi:uncharacterized protein (TIGR02996 family)
MAKQSWWRRLVDGKELVYPEDEAAPAPEREPMLEAAIAADLEAIDPYLIYSDWLCDHGDPRGELIALQARCEAKPDDGRWSLAVRTLDPWTVLDGEHASRARALVERFPIRLGGELDPGDHVEWHCGYWKRLHVDYVPQSPFTLERRIGTALRQESARFLRTLSIHAKAPLAERLPELPPSLRALHLGGSAVPTTALEWLGDLSALWARARSLDTIVLQGSSMTFRQPFEAPALRSLEVVTDDLDRRTFHAIAHSELPAIETLILWIGGRAHSSVNVDDLRGLAAMPLPNLRDLGLVKCAFVDRALEVIADAPWLPQLRVLDLSRGGLTARGLDVLERARARMPELRYLDVSQNRLDDAGRKRARTLAPQVRTTG